MASGITLMGRKQAEALMQSTVIVTRKTGSSVDHATGLEVDTFDTIYSGKCRLQFVFVRPEQANVSGQELAHERGVLSLPIIGSNGIKADDLATVTIGALDPGTTVSGRIESPFAKTHATARRFPLEITN